MKFTLLNWLNLLQIMLKDHKSQSELKKMSMGDNCKGVMKNLLFSHWPRKLIALGKNKSKHAEWTFNRSHKLTNIILSTTYSLKLWFYLNGWSNQDGGEMQLIYSLAQFYEFSVGNFFYCTLLNKRKKLQNSFFNARIVKDERGQRQILWHDGNNYFSWMGEVKEAPFFIAKLCDCQKGPLFVWPSKKNLEMRLEFLIRSPLTLCFLKTFEWNVFVYINTEKIAKKLQSAFFFPFGAIFLCRSRNRNASKKVKIAEAKKVGRNMSWMTICCHILILNTLTQQW